MGEIKEIFKDCIALLIQKINGVVLKASDNIVMSMFLGLESVALYSNYYVLYTTLNLFVNHGWISVFIHMLICGISVPVALVISVRNQTEGKYVFKLGMNYIRKIMHKKRS